MTEMPSAAGTAPPYEGKDRRHESDHDAYFNAQFDAEPVYVEPGRFQFSDKPDEMLVATVGSGVAVSIYDKDLRIGGLAYVLISDSLLDAFPFFDKADPDLLRAAFNPVMECIGAMKRAGAGKNRIRVRLMGGTTLPQDEEDRGTKNYIFVREYLVRQGLSVMNEDLAGPYIRRVHFFPESGRAVRRLLRRDSDYAALQELESEYQSKTYT